MFNHPEVLQDRTSLGAPFRHPSVGRCGGGRRRRQQHAVGGPDAYYPARLRPRVHAVLDTSRLSMNVHGDV